jgi:hypothetical protein
MTTGRINQVTIVIEFQGDAQVLFGPFLSKKKNLPASPRKTNEQQKRKINFKIASHWILLQDCCFSFCGLTEVPLTEPQTNKECIHFAQSTCFFLGLCKHKAKINSLWSAKP